MVVLRVRSLVSPLAVAGLAAASLVLVAAPAHAADSNVSTIVELNAATNVCTDGDTVTLIADISAPATSMVVGCADLTLDLNGYDLALLHVGYPLSGLTLTIRDTPGGGSLTADASAVIGAMAGIDMRSSGAPHTLNVYGGTITARGSSGAAGIGGANSSGGIVNIYGGTVNAYGGTRGAGIGGGNGGSGGTVNISGGVVNAYGGSQGAGIGGGFNSGPSTVSVTGGVVSAYGGDSGAGIGGGDQGIPGTILISGGTVNGYGGANAAGIGGGNQSWGEPSHDIQISGGNVTAVGGADGSGIGSGDSGGPGMVAISGGVVTATAGNGGAGIGGGYMAQGGTTLLSGGTVTATGGYSALGAGEFGIDFGYLEVGGLLRVPSGAFVIGDGAMDTEVVVLPTGRIEGTVADPTAGAVLSGAGQVFNGGVITLVAANVGVAVVTHNYLITFNSQGGSPTPPPVRVFATTFSSGLRPFPADPTRGALEFSGWYTTPAATGTPVTASTVLSADATLYAGWVLASTGSSAVPLIPWALGLILAGAGLLVVRRRVLAH